MVHIQLAAAVVLQLVRTTAEPVVTGPISHRDVNKQWTSISGRPGRIYIPGKGLLASADSQIDGTQAGRAKVTGGVQIRMATVTG